MKNVKKEIRVLPRLLVQSFRELNLNDPLRMAGATAFFTTFALPPILVILIQFSRLLINPDTVRNELFRSLTEIVGPEAVHQVVDVLVAIRGLAANWYMAAGGFLFLLFVATTLFKIIKSSINQIWKIRPVHNPAIASTLKSRARSVLVILVAGMLFMIGIIVEAVRVFIGDYISEYSPTLSFYFNSAIRYVLSIVMVTLWFWIVFRYLPDGRPKWRTAFAGALLTGILFSIGKIILQWLLSYSNLNTLYGTSASIMLLLLFVFYSALILYFGAAFTKIWAAHSKNPIVPKKHAMHYRIIEST